MLDFSYKAITSRYDHPRYIEDAYIEIKLLNSEIDNTTVLTSDLNVKKVNFFSFNYNFDFFFALIFHLNSEPKRIDTSLPETR